MSAKAVLSSCVAAGLLLLLALASWSAPAAVLHGVQSSQAADLDRALRAGDLQKARLLVPVSWAASEQLFVSYLERAFIPPGGTRVDPEARALAARLADVFFKIIEYDFARSVVSTLDAADQPKRQQLIAAVRDYFVTLERVRAASPVAGGASTAPAGMVVARQRSTEKRVIGDQSLEYAVLTPPTDPEGIRQRAERRLIADHLLEVAGRFRALSFPRGELWTYMSMVNLGPTAGPSPGQMMEKLRDQIGDELFQLTTTRPYTDASLAKAERLGLPRRQMLMLEEMAGSLASSTDPARLEQAARYLERARVLSRSLPLLESVNYWLFPAAVPHPSRSTLPALWSVYQKLKRPAEAGPLFAEALEASRPFGERALAGTVSAFASRAAGVDWAALQAVLDTSRAYGRVVELATMRALSGSSRFLRLDVAEKALALAVALEDPHERAVTLEWYSRIRQSALMTTVYRSNEPPPSFEEDAVRAAVKNVPPYPPVYDQLLQMCLKSDESGLVADALMSQGLFQADTGDGAAAATTLNQAIQIARQSGDYRKAAKIAGLASRSVLPVASQLAFIASAIELATMADDPSELALALRSRALTSAAASHESLRDLQQALVAAERHTAESGNGYVEVTTLMALANERAVRGEYQMAIEALERTVARTRALSTRDREGMAYQSMVEVYSKYLGEPALALAAAERAREAMTFVIGQLKPGATFSALRAAEQDFRLATLHRNLGQPAEALDGYAKAWSGFSAPPVQPLFQLNLLWDRARLLTELGDYEAALQDWEAALPLMKKAEKGLGGGPAVQRTRWLGEVARVHRLAGDREKALAAAREAVAEMGRSTTDRWVEQDIVNTVVDILLDAGAPDEAIAFCDLGHQRILALPNPQPAAERAYLVTVARADLRAGRIDTARSRLLAAVEIDKTHPTAETGWLGGSLLALGRLELDAKNYAKAAQHLREARSAANPYDQDQIWQIEQALALALARGGDAAGAAEHYDRSLTALESARGRLRPEEFRLKYGFDRLSLYEEHAALLAARAVQSGRPADADLAFQAAERKRTQVLWGLLATGWARIPPAAMPDQVRRMFEMESRIGAKQTLLREQFGQPTDKRNNALVDTLQRELKQLHGEHAGLLASMAQGQYRFAAPAALAASLAGPVRAAIGSSRVLVEYLVAEDRSYAFVVSGSGVKVVPLAVGRDGMRQQVRKLLLPFRQLRSGEVDLARLTYDTRAAHALYQTVFAPLRPSLGPVSEIVIVPDDILTFLPFDALVEQAPRSAARGPLLHEEFANEKFLVHRYAVIYLPSSAQLLVRTADSAAPRQAPKRFFAMANPAAGRTTPAPAASQDDPLKRQLRSGSLDAFLTPLPGAESEVQRIAQHFPGDATAIVTGSGATEAAYEAQAGQFGVVHFATHAVASDGQPFYSTMILAPDAGPGHDGFLQAFEVLRTPLQAELVVLSGCETALGAEDLGQGLVGLVTAFQQAGARSVPATLWSIDEATAEVMAGFYDAMAKGASTPAALRQAKVQMLQQRLRIGQTDVSLAHPFFWAPFILVGPPAAR